jgi:hypothetical protein
MSAGFEAGRQTTPLKETNMRTKIYLPMAPLIVTVALALSASAQQQVPFKGTFQGTDAVTPPTLTESNTGTGTLLGRFSSTALFSFATRQGSTQWIAANGDTIETTWVVSVVDVDMAPCQVVGAQPEDTYRKITELHTITRGTGRFAGVQGSFALTKYHDRVPRSDGITHGTCGFYTGTITPPGAVH